MSKSEYNTEDFVLDPEFRKWVLTNDPEAKRYWEEFLSTNKSKIQEVEKARKILIHLSQERFALPDSEIDLQWNMINDKIDHMEGLKRQTKVVSLDSWSAIQHHKEQSRQKRKRNFIRTAVFAFSALGCFIFAVWFQSQKFDDTQEVELSYETMEVPAGVKSNYLLPDGTEVTLNSQSKITFEKNFSGDIREIELVGEGFFDVAEDSLRPFIVKTQQVSTQALGTAFNIKAYPEEPISVSLIRGSVLVTNSEVSDFKEKLVPGEEMFATLDNSTWIKGQFDLKQALAWMNKTLIFDKTPFITTVHSLEKWFGVTFTFENDIPKNLFVTGEFKDESLKNILDGMSYSSRFSYTIDGKKVNLKFKP
ncbi:FecR family protein [Algoriphagus pacificus]|uniref:FecR domain-containing protein n=1 Tax=Algoriphagus pacificus TaxID=2811234 RepID=A0ABS3CK45_9BACT|nr:FecR domain-containing protein [Algoriphagus pacificus]MBN7817452.1 FecR domain-containing protein [Algoriphagus pacificus]